MSFWLDSLKHLLSSDPASRREGLAGMAARLWGVEGRRLQHGSLPDDVEVWHYPKAAGRPYGVTQTIGAGDRLGCEWMVGTLADRREATGDRFAALLAAVVADGTPRGAVAALPEGCLGRSSHIAAAVTPPWPVAAHDLPEYERILGAPLQLVVPVTAREAEWILAHGLDAYVAAMREQGVAPWADRPPGQTRLPT